ncbi:peroxisome biogenesis factor 1 [Brachionus plicatilis]|uniref:Peroxisome biogenesis factor 1 n=1 Tax=Brachionus plicatilis TaxID=10195 RepID=A0A3M7P214_BRAPC|nr:peroxisome biogenesis factor 1 [Brachionus plicatilis]
MLNCKNLSYNSIKNCFIYLSSLENKNLNLTENDVLEISQENKKFYFSPQFFDSAKSQESIFLNGLYAKKLGLGDNSKLNVDFIHHESPIASSVTLKPVTEDDWQILELNLESDQILPIWIDSDLCIYL